MSYVSGNSFLCGCVHVTTLFPAVASGIKDDAECFTQLVTPSLSCWISLSTAKLAAGQPKHLLFEVQPGSDATALWKVAVRVLCTKVRPKTPLHADQCQHEHLSMSLTLSEGAERHASGENKRYVCVASGLLQCTCVTCDMVSVKPNQTDQEIQWSDNCFVCLELF